MSASISIIIPTKNEGKYIGPTLAQFEGFLEKYNLEIIVSDANSTDDTLDIIRQYQVRFGDRLRVASSQPGKQNIAIGRNLGAKDATGNLLFHMDADVRIPNPARFFEKSLAKFQNPNVVAATAPLWVYPEESGLHDRAYHLFMNSVIRLSFIFGVYLAKGECQLVRRAAFEQIGGYNEKLVAGEDCNLFYRLHYIGKMAYLYRLRIFHSPRRFRAYGYVGTSLIYLREGLSLLFFRKSYAEEWTPVR